MQGVLGREVQEFNCYEGKSFEFLMGVKDANDAAQGLQSFGQPEARDIQTQGEGGIYG